MALELREREGEGVSARVLWPVVQGGRGIQHNWCSESGGSNTPSRDGRADLTGPEKFGSGSEGHGNLLESSVLTVVGST